MEMHTIDILERKRKRESEEIICDDIIRAECELYICMCVCD